MSMQLTKFFLIFLIILILLYSFFFHDYTGKFLERKNRAKWFFVGKIKIEKGKISTLQ